MRSFYDALRGLVLRFPLVKYWCVKAPRRVSFFVWIVAWGKILTCDNLVKKGNKLVGWCCMCLSCGETMVLLLLHCNVAFELWSLVIRSFEFQWVLPGMVTNLLGGGIG